MERFYKDIERVKREANIKDTQKRKDTDMIRFIQTTSRSALIAQYKNM